MVDTDLALWEQELGSLARRSAALDHRWGWLETLTLIAILAAAPVGFLIGLML